jgi:membrane protein implicated in regulation of membrane protease activity
VRWRTYTTLGAVTSAILGLAAIAFLTRDLWYGDWWLAGFTLTASVLAFTFGLIEARRRGSPYDGMTVKEVREKGRRGELPPALTPDDLRGWRRMMVLMWLSVPALPLLMLYVGLSLWASLAVGVLALCGAISYVVVYRLMRRSAAESRELLSERVTD